MKLNLIKLLPILLTGCIYDSEGECWRPIIETVTTNCEGYNGKNYPVVARYQKRETLGRTDPIQRWKDIVACGGKYGDINSEDAPRNYEINGKFYEYLGQCMSDKGYIHLYPAQCGFMNSKKDTGKCNL